MLLSYTLSRPMRIEEDMVDQPFNSSEKRLARALQPLATTSVKKGKPQLALPPISQETLADRIGTTRSRIKFRRLRLIKYNETPEVYSSLLNVVL